MYTFNLFCYGIDMSVEPELNNFLGEYELNFKIGDREWELDFPYHGGQCRGDVFSCVFGTIISDDDNNPHFLNEVRHAKESDYEPGFRIFIEKFLTELEEIRLELDDVDIVILDKTINFIKNTKPSFYMVEASS